MRSDSYYSKGKIAFITAIALIAYMISISLSGLVLRDAIIVQDRDFVPNFNKNYLGILPLTSVQDNGSDSKDKYTLQDIKYDPNTLYLDWSEIEAERKRLKEEAKKQEIANNFRPSIEPTVEPNGDVAVAKDSLPLPDIADTSFKGYMCLHTVTSKTSKQWEFLHSGKYEFKTDPNGILMYKNYYVVAMGSYYTNYKVGSTFRVTLDSGVVFDVITGEEKADIHTDALNMYRPKGSGRGEIIEFLVACGQTGANCNQYDVMPEYARRLGNLSSLGFQGNVVKIEKLDDYSVSNNLYD